MSDFPDHFKTQKMRIRAVEKEHLKTEEMCKEAVCRKPYALSYVTGHFKTQEMCIRAVEENP